MKKQRSVIISTGVEPAEPTAEQYPRLNPDINSTKKSTVHCHREGGSPWRSAGGQAGLLFGSLLKNLHLINCGGASGTWIATRSATARNDAGGRVGFLFGGWSLKSHVQPLWMALSAFTMAEILLSLTIIGVVAAITLPSLTGNINERTWNTQRKALYARMSQAIALMPALNGYGTFAEATDSAAAIDNAAETFVTAGLSKVFKINNICNSFSDCGIVSKITPMLATSQINMPQDWEELNTYTTSPNSAWGSRAANINTQAVAFETANGESILALYNPNCKFYMNEKNSSSSVEYHYSTQEKVCLNLIYDLNGTKGPNTVGKDIGFISVLYPTDSVVTNAMPTTQISSNGTNFENAIKLCKKQDNDLRLPTPDELTSMYINQKLIYGTLYSSGTNYWSSISVSSTLAWAQGFTTGDNYIKRKSDSNKVHCVKR